MEYDEKLDKPASITPPTTPPGDLAGDADLEELDRSCVRTLDWTILPITSALYFLAFVDKSNIGNAAIAGLKTDLNLSPQQYLTAITCTYVLYIVAEFPANLLLKKIGPHILLPTLVTTWGGICTLTGRVQNYHGLIALRLMLGLVEGGLLPGLVLYLSMFYRRRELQLRISLFFSATSLSGAFSGLLAAAIIKMDGVGNQAGWRWIFYLEGIFTVLFGIMSFYFLPASPGHSRYFTPEQKAHVAYRLALDRPADDSVAGADDFSWREVFAAFKSPHVCLTAVAQFSSGCTLYSFSIFTPQIVSTFDYSTVHTQLLTVPPFVCAFIVTVLTAWWSDRKGRRGVSVMATSCLAIVGLSIFLTCEGRNARYASLFISITGAYGSAPAMATWISNNSAPHTRKASAIAIGFTMTNSAGLMSTWLFPSTEGPSYRRGTIVNITLAGVTTTFAFLNLRYLMWANAQKALRRKAMEVGEWPSELVGSRTAEGDRAKDFIYSL